MNPDRLDELRRQRAIVRDHLAWLENEIAAQVGGVPSLRDAAPPIPQPAPISPVPPGETAPDAAATAASARRGCLSAVTVMLLIVAIALVAIYFARYRDRPLFFASPAESAAPAK